VELAERALSVLGSQVCALRVCERIRKAVEQLALNSGDAPVSVTAP